MALEDTAEGVLTIVNANMANAIRSRGPEGAWIRGFSLVAFGGAGPLHGVEVARALGIPEVIVPRYPGITSAIGLLTTDLKYDTIKTAFMTSGSVDYARLNVDFAAMQTQLVTQYQADGIAENDVTFARAGDLRYVGQGYELRVPFPSGTLDSTAMAQVFAAFEAPTRRIRPCLRTVRSKLSTSGSLGIGVMPKSRPQWAWRASDALVKTAPCVFRVNGGLARVETPFYHRERLPWAPPSQGQP
jgi:N-methylhydantoinase A